MNPRIFKKGYESAVGAVLWLALYSRLAPEGLLGAVLAAGMACLMGGLAFFLRIWLPVIWVQGLYVLIAAAIGQTAWAKMQLWPWWTLSFLSVVLPALENIRAESVIKTFAGNCGLFLACAVVFLFLRQLLEQSAFSFLGEHASGIFLVLGLISLLIPPGLKEET